MKVWENPDKNNWKSGEKIVRLHAAGDSQNYDGRNNDEAK